MLWLGVIDKPLYRQAIGHLTAERPHLGIAAAFYLIWATGTSP